MPWLYATWLYQFCYKVSPRSNVLLYRILRWETECQPSVSGAGQGLEGMKDKVNCPIPADEMVPLPGRRKRPNAINLPPGDWLVSKNDVSSGTQS